VRAIRGDKALIFRALLATPDGGFLGLVFTAVGGGAIIAFMR